MTDKLTTSSLHIVPGAVNAEHAVADHFDIYAFAGTDAPTLRATVPGGPEGVEIVVQLSDFNPPLALGDETIIVKAINSDGEGDSQPFPFTLRLPPAPPSPPTIDVF